MLEKEQKEEKECECVCEKLTVPPSAASHSELI